MSTSELRKETETRLRGVCVGFGLSPHPLCLISELVAADPKYFQTRLPNFTPGAEESKQQHGMGFPSHGLLRLSDAAGVSCAGEHMADAARSRLTGAVDRWLRRGERRSRSRSPIRGGSGSGGGGAGLRSRSRSRSRSSRSRDRRRSRSSGRSRSGSRSRSRSRSPCARASVAAT
jgi:hypothetical protein